MSSRQAKTGEAKTGVKVGLSARVFGLAVSFIMIAELLIFVPSVSQFRISWLQDRLANAQIAALALLASEDQMVSESLREELLLNANVKAVVLQRSDQKHLILSDDMPPMTGAFYDLDQRSWTQSIYDALGALVRQEARYIRVRGMAQHEPGGYVEIVIDEEPLCAAMLSYGRNILILSIVIALIAGGLLYMALAGLLISPLQRLTSAMIGFRDEPESNRYLVAPTSRGDELGAAQDGLAAMQRDIQHHLKMQKRQAALGRAVQKINHDLRNIFATVQLLSDRLTQSQDPAVKNIAPRFVGAVDRALSMSRSVLKYGSAEEAPPQLVRFDLHSLVAEVEQAVIVTDQAAVGVGEDQAGAQAQGREAIRFVNKVPVGFDIIADSDQLFRVLMNLTRNAYQAIQRTRGGGNVTLCAAMDGDDILIDVMDTAAGIPAALKERLFEPFISSSLQDGTGLGLAIARELVEGHGGHIALIRTGEDGSCFRICLPNRNAE